MSSTFKLRFQKGFEVIFSLQWIRQPLAKSDGVRVIVLPGQRGVLGGSHQRATNSCVAIRRDADADTGTADQDEAFPLMKFFHGAMREVRVIHGGEAIRPVVQDIVSIRQGPALEPLFEVKARVITRKTNLHIELLNGKHRWRLRPEAGSLGVPSSKHALMPEASMAAVRP